MGAERVGILGVEATFVAVAGIVLGGVGGCHHARALQHRAERLALPQGPLWIYRTVIESAILLAFAATLAPAWITLPSRPVEVLAAVA